MWRGQRWARWFLVAIYVVGLAFRLALIVRAPHVLDIARATQQFVSALLLAAPPSVGTFLAAQRNQQSNLVRRIDRLSSFFSEICRPKFSKSKIGPHRRF